MIAIWDLCTAEWILKKRGFLFWIAVCSLKGRSWEVRGSRTLGGKENWKERKSEIERERKTRETQKKKNRKGEKQKEKGCGRELLLAHFFIFQNSSRGSAPDTPWKSLLFLVGLQTQMQFLNFLFFRSPVSPYGSSNHSFSEHWLG